MYDLQGQVALVTGAGGELGIGRAIARRLAAEGADVVVNDFAARPYPDAKWGGLDAAVAEIEALGRRAAAGVADVGDPQQVDRMVSEALQTMGRIDILVNNAGALAGRDRVPVVQLEVDLWDAVQRVNIRGTFLCSRAVARHMLERGGGGRIINISSVAGKRGMARYSAYNASKFAVIGFTQSLANEVAPHNITVNAVCPGILGTTMWLDVMLQERSGQVGQDREAAFREFAKTLMPLGRPQTPDDIGEAVVYLAQADNVTGIALNVAGGYVMH